MRSVRVVWLMSMSLFLSIFIISCENHEFNQENLNDKAMLSPEIVKSSGTVYFNETFTVSSARDGLSVTRQVGNADIINYENFMITVQNGSSGRTKVSQLEISLGNVMISHKDFKGNASSVTLPVTGLTESSNLNVKLQGSAGRFVVVTITAIPMSVTDIDGNVYRTVKIGDQWWMAENLKTTKFNDGTPLMYVPDNAEWESLYMTATRAAYCWLDNDLSNKQVYGAIYDFRAVGDARGEGEEEDRNRNICPVGWHVPTGGEFFQMISFVDPNATERQGPVSGTAGILLSEAGYEHWKVEYNPATNETGFTNLPSGYRLQDGIFVKYNGWYSDKNASGTWNIDTRQVGFTHGHPGRGYSVRCIRD